MEKPSGNAPYHFESSWGEKPNLTREDVLIIAGDIYSRGNTDLANAFIDGYDNREEWIEIQIRNYIERLGQ